MTTNNNNSKKSYFENKMSKTQATILFYMKEVFGDDNVENNYQFNKLEIDVFVPKYSFGIEFDSKFHLSDKRIQYDENKNQSLKEYEITLIRLRERYLPQIEMYGQLVLENIDCRYPKKYMKALFKVIEDNIKLPIYVMQKLSSQTFDIAEDDIKIMELYHKIIEQESFGTKYTQLLKYWDHVKNGDLTPFMFRPKSKEKLWWKCDMGHSYLRSLSKVSNDPQCPKCMNRIITNENCLSTTHPLLAKEFHPTLNNNLTPENTMAGQDIIITWVCRYNNEHIWENTIRHRANGNQGCPYCAGKKPTSENNFARLHPNLLIEWDYLKNEKKGLDPFKILPNVMKLASWICPNCKSYYDAMVCHRTRTNNSACPYCAGQKINKTNSIESLYPKLAKEWHPTRNGSLKPSNVSRGSGRKVWWLCSEGHEWETQVKVRTMGCGCPECYKLGLNKQSS
jgi:Probable Zinc-ribbon domain